MYDGMLGLVKVQLLSNCCYDAYKDSRNAYAVQAEPLAMGRIRQPWHVSTA